MLRALRNGAAHRSRATATLSRRPTWTIAAVGLVFTATQAWWNHTHRHLGAFNVDEEGGLAAAYRFARATGVNPRPLFQEVFSTWNGPLVPLAAVPLKILGPDSVVTVMAVQSVMVVLAAVGTAGIVAHVADRNAALLAGLLVMWLPVSVVSSRSFQYSTGVAAFLALALWALVASDRGADRLRMAAFGAATGAMLLSRTMSAAFLPALAAAAAIVVAPSRRGLANAAIAGGTAVAVAGPWWWVQWDAITGYLTENAYGDRARYWGSVPWGRRIADHFEYFVNDFRALVIVGWLACAAAVALVARWAMLRRRTRAAEWRGDPRLLVAVVVAGGLGRLALLSTSNLGFWFAYPLDITIVAGVVGLVAIAPRRSADRHRWQRAAAFAALAVVTIGSGAAAGVDAAGALPESDWRWAVLADHSALQGGNLEADVRMGDPDRAVVAEAAAEWWIAGARIARAIDEIGRDGPVLQTVVGEIHLMNANTVALAQEVTGLGIHGVLVVNTLEPPDDEVRRDLSPTLHGTPRVVVLVTGRSLAFPNGRGRERFRQLAVEEGWRQVERIALPDSGDVTIWTHPDNDRPR